MENFLYYNNPSNPNSVNSSPRSRDIDLDYSSPWDEQQQRTNHKVKFLCSYGGRINLRQHDNQLTYVGGDTKIFAVDRNVKFVGFLTKLVNLCGFGLNACFKYQLPGEDLDSLISVTNDVDLEHMMVEYDRIYRVSGKPARLRLFIFSKNNLENVRDESELESEIYRSDDSKGSIGQWYVDVLNGGSGSPRVEKKLLNPDYLFGLEKGESQPQPNSLDVVAAPPKVRVKKEFDAAVLEEQYVIGGSPVKKGENIQRQMNELQRMQISSNTEDYYPQNDQFQPGAQHMSPAAGYWQERNEFFPAGASIPPQQTVYLVQTPAGVYQTPGQVNRAFYGVQGMVPGVYREQQPVIQRPQVSPAAYPAAMVGLSQPNGVVEGGGGGGGFTQLGHKPVAGRDYYHHFP